MYGCLIKVFETYESKIFRNMQDFISQPTKGQEISKAIFLETPLPKK